MISIPDIIDRAAGLLQSVKFDDLCTNFTEHMTLDESESLLTVTKNQADQITGMTLSRTGTAGAGVIPVTIPKTMDATVSAFSLHLSFSRNTVPAAAAASSLHLSFSRTTVPAAVALS